MCSRTASFVSPSARRARATPTRSSPPTSRAPQRAVGHLRRGGQEDRRDLRRDGGRVSRDPAIAADAHAARPPYARRGDGLPDGTAAWRPREPGHRRSRDALGDARGGLRRHAQRPGHQRHPDVRSPGHDRRARRGGSGRAQPADPRHPRRLRDRLCDRDPRRRAAVEPDPVPAEFRVRSRDRRAACQAQRALHSGARRSGARVNQARRLLELLAPALLVLATAWLGLEVSRYLEPYFLDTLVKVAIVVSLYLFIGNSGVLSFGQISFVALGAWTA